MSSVLLASGPGASVALEGVTLTSNAVSAPLAGLLQAASGAALRVQNCTFSGNTAPFDLVDLSGTSQVFADDGGLRLFYGDGNGEFARIQPLSATPKGRFLDAEDGPLLVCSVPPAPLVAVIIVSVPSPSVHQVLAHACYCAVAIFYAVQVWWVSCCAALCCDMLGRAVTCSVTLLELTLFRLNYARIQRFAATLAARFPA